MSSPRRQVRGRGGHSGGGGRTAGRRPSARGRGNRHGFTESPRMQSSPMRRSHGRTQRVYQDYMALTDVRRGLAAGSLFRGKLRINANRRSTAFMTADGGVLPFDIFIENEKTRNRAQEGDLECFDAARELSFIGHVVQMERVKCFQEGCRAISPGDEDICDSIREALE